MARSNAYADYLKRHRELTLLLSLGKTSVTASHAQDSLTIGVALARAIVVLLAGHIEAFFNSLLIECVCELPDNWGDMSQGQRKYLALRMTEELFQNLNRDEAYGEHKQIEKLRGLIEKMYSWTNTPNQAMKSGAIGSLKGLYKGIAPDAIEVLLKRLHPDTKSFFEWIQIKGYDRSRIWTVLQQLVNERTEIAHGDLETQPTLSDARLYVITAAVVARLADEFMRSTFPHLNTTPSSPTLQTSRTPTRSDTLDVSSTQSETTL